jgi:very-short-patch-repair endonuclease
VKREEKTKQQFRLFLRLCDQENLTGWVVEHKFHPFRKWRFDIAWPAHRVAIEVQGGTFAGGAHIRGKQYQADCEKMRAAVILCWSVLAYTTDEIKHHPYAAISDLRILLGKGGESHGNHG